MISLVDGLTIVRVRGAVQAFLSGAFTALEGYHCALGICIVNEDAFAIGATAVPDPIADSGWDGWFYHRFFDVHSSHTEVEGGDLSRSISFEVDSKAMRKIPEENVIVAALEVVELGIATMQVYFDSRVLFKLP